MILLSKTPIPQTRELDISYKIEHRVCYLIHICVYSIRCSGYNYFYYYELDMFKSNQFYSKKFYTIKKEKYIFFIYSLSGRLFIIDFLFQYGFSKNF